MSINPNNTISLAVGCTCNKLKHECTCNKSSQNNIVYKKRCNYNPTCTKPANFNLNKFTRAYDDPCYHNWRDKQNMHIFDFSNNVYQDLDCRAKNIEEIAMNEPTITYRDGYGWSDLHGCNIDADSRVRNARNLTNMRDINQLNKLPYNTVPYMSSGNQDTSKENKLRFSLLTGTKRPCNVLSGIHLEHQYTPLIPYIEDSIQDPIHLIENDVKNDWIRGGIPSRDLIRNINYISKK
jgi:hypothetical protein